MKNKFCIFLLFFIVHSAQMSATVDFLVLRKGNFRIVVSDKELPPVTLAVETLQRDFKSVMGFCPPIVSGLTDREEFIELIIINESIAGSSVNTSELRPLDGFESHRVYADTSSKRIFLMGKDMRGTIYAIYTFSEKILDVPPLWFFSSCNQRRESK